MFNKISTLLWFARAWFKQSRWLERFIQGILATHLIKCDEYFTSHDLTKIRKYYGIGVPLVLGNMMCSLHGKAMTDNERRILSAMGAISGLYDDFFDKHQLPEETIRQLTVGSKVAGEVKTNVIVFQILLQEVMKRIPDRAAFQTAFLSVFDSQMKSLAQREFISLDRLLDLSIQKGGYSLLFYRQAFSVELKDDEKKFWFQTGALGQFCNDIFDIHKDQQEGIHTFANSCYSIDQLKEEFQTQRIQWKTCLRNLPFGPVQKRRCELLFELAVLSRTQVCLDKLKEKEQFFGGYQPMQWPRKALVVDMQQLANALRQLKHYFKN